MAQKLRIALAQIKVSVGSDSETLDKNSKKIYAACQQAVEENADIVVAPELAICGYSPEDLLNRNDVRNAISHATESLIERLLDLKLSNVLFGAPRVAKSIDGVFPQGLKSLTTLDLGETALANAIINVKGKEGIHSEIYKMKLPNWGVFDEARIFASASEVAEPFMINDVLVGVLNCRDVWHESSVRALVEKGARCILVPNASPYANVRHKERLNVVSGWARKFSVPIVYVNTVHGCDELVFDGGSFVVDADGKVIFEAERFKEDLSVVEVEIPDKCVVDESVEVLPDLSGSLAHVNFDPEEAYKAIILGLQDFINSISVSSSVVIGLSGGVDSALVATLAVDAFGKDRVHGVLMPSIYTSERSTSDAMELVKRLGISSEEISISSIQDAAVKSLNIDSSQDLASQNVQSRIRGMILMAQSNMFGRLVLATSNKSESAVGYSTLYGDTVGAYGPIKDVYKTQVYELCEWRNKQPVDVFEIENPIPREIIERAPTAELKENQTDEESLLPYEVLDGILERFVDFDMSFDEIVDAGYKVQDVERIVELIKRSEFKRKQTPPGPRLTRRNFGKSRRIPISAKW